MKKDMGRRFKVRSVSFLTSLIIALAIWGGVNAAKVSKYEKNLNASQQRALANLSTYMDSISSNLQKGIYANTSPMLANIASQVWLESTAAKNSLAELPAQHEELINTYKFLSQVGDYTMSLNEKVSKGQKITSDETESLFSMMDVASKLSEQVSYLLAEELVGNLNYSEKQSAKDTKEIGKSSEDTKIQFNGVLNDSD